MTLAQSEAPATPQRLIEFERCFNFRDLGGYETGDGRRVRWRRLFRSMTPEYVSERDVETARMLNIGLVIDLRGPRFKTSGPLGEPPARRESPGTSRTLIRSKAERVAYIELTPEQALPQVLDRMGRTFARAAAFVAEADTAALVHCRLGKDRTGVLSAIVLSLLGVERATVVEDYLLSERYIEDALRLVKDMEEPSDVFGTESRVAREPPSRSAIEATLDRLEQQYGGAEAYLLAHGLSRRRIKRLAGRLLE